MARHKAAERQGHTSPLPVILGVLTLAGVAFALLPARAQKSGSSPAAAHTPSFARIQSIVAQRCAVCHSTNPTQPGFSAPPNGVLLDTPAHILANVIQTQQQVASRAMPLGNITGITEKERIEMLSWLQNGNPR